MNIDELKQVIQGRPVVILLPGPSIKMLEERIEELRGLDLCYASVNDFWVLEDKILSKIDKQFEMVFCAAIECEVPQEEHISFVSREKANIFLTEEANVQDKSFLTKYLNRIFLFTTDHLYGSLNCPNEKQPVHFFAQASFMLLLSVALIGGSDTIILFGADGGDRKKEGLYYPGWKSESEFRLGYDTGVVNMIAIPLMRNVALTYKIARWRVVNCSPDSYYCPFPLSTYDKTFEFLKDEYGKIS